MLADLGLSYRHQGYFSRALAAFAEAWREGRDATGRRAPALVDRAVGELVRLDADFGRERQLAALLAEIGERPLAGPAAELVKGGRAALWAVRHDPKQLLPCGPAALGALLRARRVDPERFAFLDEIGAGAQATSFAQLASLASKAHFAAEIVFRRPGASVPVPSVVHWRVGHFAAIAGETGGRFHIVDAGFGPDGLWLTRAAIDAEASGYFLVPQQDAHAAQWRRVASAEADRVRGAGPISGYSGNPLGGDGADPVTGNSGNGCMCGYGIDAETATLDLTDTPVGYTPPIGPAARVTIGYAQGDQNQPANFNYFNVGPKWTLNWLSFVTDDPAAPGSSVTRYLRNGALYSYTGYDSGSGAFTAQEDDGSVLVRTTASPITYTRYLRDGSIEVYAHSDGGTSYPRNIFLKEIADPQGNTLTLYYDAVNGAVRLVSLTDAAGRKTSFAYGLTGNPLLVTRITDPFGRSASLTYNGSGELAAITDVLGLTSSFGYDASGLVDAMTTPYGTSQFAYGANINGIGGVLSYYLNITDPLGYGEHEEAVPSGGTANNDPPGTVPQRMQTQNLWLDFRNSFHWDKHQYVIAGCKPSGGCNDGDARLTHFTHFAGSPGLASPVAESSREPLENRVWFNYPGQSISTSSGSYDQPSAIGRVLDGGQTQLTQIGYTCQPIPSSCALTSPTGNPTSIIDPVLRQTTFGYAANNIDITSVQQKNTVGQATIAQFTWNNQHRPLTYTDAAGQVWNYTYNAAGQVATVSDPLGETTSYNYNATGDLVSIVDADGKTAASFTYDGFDRVASYTDAGGWTAGFAYDAADRLTEVLYPDGTTDAYAYIDLDLGSYTNRAGQVWSYAHDADRRLVSVADPNGNQTQFAYYENGQLKSLTDGNGHITSWDIDDESRPVAEHYADATSVGYAWDETISLLAGRTDARGETRSYGYALDNRLASIAYTNTLNPTPNVAFAWSLHFPRLNSMTDGSGTTAYSYWPVGGLGALRVETETGPLAAIGDTYDALGRLASRTVGKASPETFGYDAIGRLESHGTALGTFAYGYLGETGQVTSRALAGGGGLATSWSYLGNYRDRRLAAITNTPGRSFAYTTTQEDLVTAIAETPSPPGQDWSFSYDAANRLTGGQSTSEGGYPYTLDPAGNITAFGTTAASYNSVNALTALGGTAYDWDADGNLLSYGARSFAWDAENRLAQISYGAAPKSTAFAYDGLGRRVAIAETDSSGNTTSTGYVWCGDRLCQSQYANGAIQRQYYPEGEYIPGSGTSIYYGPDQLGSVRDAYATSPVLSVVEAYDYDPYGNPLARPATGPYPDFRYAGTFNHATSGLQLTRTRAYDPAIARFLSRDPLGEQTDPAASLYRYADGNPLSYVDPQGTQFVPAILGGAALGAAFDLGGQLLRNRGNLACLDWPEIGAAAASGALFGALGPAFDALAAVEAELAGITAAEETEAADVAAATPIGRSGNPIDVAPGTNQPGAVAERDYTGHAFDQMQGRGIPSSAVENTIQNGVPGPGNLPGRTTYYDPANNLTAVTDSTTGRVITVRQGPP